MELLTLQQAEIEQGLLEGSLDLGLVNVLGGDDPPVDLVGTDLLHGRPVVVLPAGHPLAAQQQVTVDDLRAERFVAMRAGYLMHRFAHRLFGARDAGHLPQHRRRRDGQDAGRRGPRRSPCCPTTAWSATRWSGPA